MMEASGIPELSDPDAMRVRRVLRVESDGFSGGYLVVEIDTHQGEPLANVMMTRDGSVQYIEDQRQRQRRAPLDLTDVSARARAHGITSATLGYVYFHNVAERGISLCRPLVVMRTTEGDIYVSSSGAAFVEQHSAIATRLLGDASDREPITSLPGMKALVAIGPW